MRRFTLMMAVLLTALVSFAQEGTEATFDFDVLAPGVSNNSHEGDITSDLQLTAGDVTLTISPSGKNDVNRFWTDYNTQKKQLRVYGGTLTFSVPEGHTLTKMVFNIGSKWGDGNSTDVGYLDGATWTGDNQEVVVSIAANSQIFSIVCTMDGTPGTGESTDALVTIPESATQEDWAIDGTYQTSEGNESVVKATKVAFDGTDIYIQGLAYYFEDAWIKGTISNGQATFPSGQFVGEDDYGKEYLMGTTTGKDVVDITFTYDADAKTLTLENAIAESASKTTISAYGYWTALQLYAGAPIKPEVVVAPENLETSEYLLTATNHVAEYDEQGQETGETKEEAYQGNVLIGFDGKDVYIQRLCTYLPEAWAKGTLSDDNKTITIPAAQYMGKYETYFGDYDFYLTDADTETGELKDLVLNYDQATNTLTTSQLFFSGDKSALSMMVWYSDVTMTKLNEVAATPQDPAIANFNAEGTYPYVELTIPTKGTNDEDLLTTKLSYQLYIEKNNEQQPLTLTTDKYEMIEEDMTEIPFTYTDEWDIYVGGSLIYLEQGLEELQTWTKIGVQSIYRGAGVENKSNIAWMDLTEYWASLGINDVNAQQGSARYFNLQGHEVNATAKGLVIKQFRQNDGSLKTVKVVNK